ncbi:FUSC family protein [Galactobacter sp.]|uniref:FUSC family protein n=1 Tax=Galactobacter sp. TaxID=2676125 RepID=UPI0025B8C7E3|nr:FUSC family protein [Galactobacter sp.]
MSPTSSTSGPAAADPGGHGQRFWRELTSMSPLNGDIQVGVKAGICLLVPLLILLGLGRPDLFGAVGFGAFSTLFARNIQPRAALRIQAEGGSAVLGAVMLGVAISAFLPKSVAGLFIIAAYASVIQPLNQARGWRAPAGLFMGFAAGAFSNLNEVTWPLAGQIFATALATSLFGLGLTWLQSLGRNTPATSPAPTTVPYRSKLFTADTVWMLTAGLVAALLGWLVTPEHAYWALVCSLVLTTRPLRHRWKIRTLHRVLGTVIGAVIAMPLLVWTPSPWVAVILLPLVQALTEIFVLRNYAVGVMFITVQALLMTVIAHPASGPDVAVERLLATAVGLGCGIVTILIQLLADRRRQRHGKD